MFSYEVEQVFTGIISDVGEILEVKEQGEGLRRLTIACGYDPDTIDIGASIACAGPCLTVVARGSPDPTLRRLRGREVRGWFAVDVAVETLRVTTAGSWQVGTKLNLERSLRLGDELGGHLVSGHIDGVAELVARTDFHDSARLMLRAPAALMRFIAVKGSVVLDGVSLTVNEVGEDAFSLLLIPHTLQVTTLGALRAGDRANLEVDLMARYAARLLATANVNTTAETPTTTT